MKMNETPDPVYIALFGARAEMLAADRIPHLLQQPRPRRGRPRIDRLPEHPINAPARLRMTRGWPMMGISQVQTVN